MAIPRRAVCASAADRDTGGHRGLHQHRPPNPPPMHRLAMPACRPPAAGRGAGEGRCGPGGPHRMAEAMAPPSTLSRSGSMSARGRRQAQFLAV